MTYSKPRWGLNPRSWVVLSPVQVNRDGDCLATSQLLVVHNRLSGGQLLLTGYSLIYEMYTI